MPRKTRKQRLLEQVNDADKKGVKLDRLAEEPNKPQTKTVASVVASVERATAKEPASKVRRYFACKLKQSLARHSLSSASAYDPAMVHMPVVSYIWGEWKPGMSKGQTVYVWQEKGDGVTPDAYLVLDLYERRAVLMNVEGAKLFLETLRDHRRNGKLVRTLEQQARALHESILHQMSS